MSTYNMFLWRNKKKKQKKKKNIKTILLKKSLILKSVCQLFGFVSILLGSIDQFSLSKYTNSF